MSTDIFIGLNAIRALSMISLILVFASRCAILSICPIIWLIIFLNSIVVMVQDVNAFNRFMDARQNTPSGSANATMSAMMNRDYIS